VPYNDRAAVGRITLCNTAGRAVTSGDVHDKPFVWTAVTDLPAPQGYEGSGRTALLYAFQPRPMIEPGNWSGQALVAASRYQDPAHPTIQATYLDDPLVAFTDSYTPQVNRLLQLRVYLGAPNHPVYNSRYAALDVQISTDGSTWTALDPGSALCSAGHATSVAAILNLPGARATAPLPSSVAGLASSPAASNSTPIPRVRPSADAGATTTAGGSGRPESPAAPAPLASGSRPGAGPPGAGPPGATPPSRPESRSTSAAPNGSNTGRLLALVLGLIALAAACAGTFLFRMRRNPKGQPPGGTG